MLHQLRLLRSGRAEEAAAATAQGNLAHDVLVEPCPLLGDELAEYGFASMGGMSDIEEDEPLPERGFGELPGPPACSYLQVGTVFAGKQRVTHVVTQKREHWGVVVRIQGIDLDRGYVCGTMEASNVPDSASPVITFWEGEVIDNRNHSFMTWKWEATKESDMNHWKKFAGFAPLIKQVERFSGRCSRLGEHPYVFMRWKEQFFVNQPADCRLTIAGFYYVCLNRATGEVEGLYYDRSSSPFQRLDLVPVQAGRLADGSAKLAAQPSGHNFTGYDLR